jgi:rod shape-determining protein MreD
LNALYFILLFCLACVFELMTLPNNVPANGLLLTPYWLSILFWIQALKNQSRGTVHLAWGLGLLVDALLDEVLGTNALIFSLVVLIGQSVSPRWVIYSRIQKTILVFFGLCLIGLTEQLYLEIFDQAAWNMTFVLRAFTSALVWIGYELLRSHALSRKMGIDN